MVVVTGGFIGMVMAVVADQFRFMHLKNDRGVINISVVKNWDWFWRHMLAGEWEVRYAELGTMRITEQIDALRVWATPCISRRPAISGLRAAHPPARPWRCRLAVRFDVYAGSTICTSGITPRYIGSFDLFSGGEISLLRAAIAVVSCQRGSITGPGPGRTAATEAFVYLCGHSDPGFLPGIICNALYPGWENMPTNT